MDSISYFCNATLHTTHAVVSTLNLYIKHQRVDMEMITRLEAQILIPSEEGNFVESGDPSNSNILHERLFTPKRLCSEIDSLMRNFWWGHKHKEKRIHWMKCEKMGSPKTQGCLGFRDFHCFNKALLAKQIWRLWKNPNSLIARIMKAKYHPNDLVLEATLGKKNHHLLEDVCMV